MQLLNGTLTWVSFHYLGGIPVDRINTVLAVLLSYALSHLYVRIPSSQPTRRHLFSIAAALFLFGTIQEQYLGLVHLSCGSLVAYAMIQNLKSHKQMPLLVFLAAMAHLSYSHIRRQKLEMALGTSIFDYTGAQMVLVIKVTSLAYCIRDGQEPDKDKLTDYQKRNAIRDNVSLLEYLGYVFFFPGFAVGPAFELSTYRKMICLQKPTNQISKAYTCLATGFGWMALFVGLNPYFSFHYVLSTEFTELNFWLKPLYVCLTGLVTRAAYYTAWKISEGACIITGLGQDQEISNANIRQVEMSSSIKGVFDGWNIGTNTWLRHHVYMRFISKTGKKSGSARATLLTFMVSSWWHGFWPGYYVTFTLGSLGASAARTLRKNLRPWVVQKPAPVRWTYSVLGWMLSQYTLNFVVMPFVLLDLSKSLQAWRNNYFLVPIGVVVVEVAFKVLGLGKYLRVKSSSP